MLIFIANSKPIIKRRVQLFRTNNYSEGFNRGLLSLLSYSHPTISKFISGLLKQQRLNVMNMEQFLSKVPPNPRSSQLRCASRLKSSVMKYGQLSTLDFLRGVAYSI